MRKVFLLLSMLLAYGSLHAQLTANAGPDKVVCTWRDSPILGGFSAASGGVPPYRYTWTCVGQPYYEYYFLDSPRIAHPRAHLSGYGRPDSLTFSLKVTDSLNNVAYDTVLVYFNNVISYFFTPIVFKGAADTVQLKMEQECVDHFGGYHDLIWTPGTYLLDSTVQQPLCYAPVMMQYRLTWVNRIGCRNCAASTDVEIKPTGVETAAIQGVALTVTDKGKLMVNAGAMHLPCRLDLFDLSGRRLFSEKLLRTKVEIDLKGTSGPGLYIYSITASDGRMQKGRLKLP